MKDDKRKAPHPLFKGQPAHVLKLRQSAEKQRRLEERRKWKASKSNE